MKTSFFIACALALPLAQVAQADDHNNSRNSRHSHSVTQTEQARIEAARAQAARPLQRSNVNRSNPLYPPHRTAAARNSVSPVRARTGNRAAPIYRGSTVNNSGRFRDRSRENNVAVQNNRAVNRNGGNRNVNRNSYAVARTRVVHTYHDRGWWRSHYNTTFVLFGGGYYYWDAGYWYPAFGYDPYYNNYAYSEPIYGYNDLPPGEVLENVQIALRDEGYYNGAIDGLIGPQTRAALAAYQRDHGLVITEAVDEPTLVTLGLA